MADGQPFVAGEREHLIPHATAEDAVLYPEVEQVMGAPGSTATMRREHVEVARLTSELAETRTGIGSGPIGARRRRRLRQLLYGLHAVVGLHFAKEEEIYLPELDRTLTAAGANAMFERMERAASDARPAAGEATAGGAR